MCRRKHNRSDEQICLPQSDSWLAGRNEFNLRISLSYWGLRDNLAQSPACANGEAKV